MDVTFGIIHLRLVNEGYQNTAPLKGMIHLLVTEQVSTEGGRWLCLHRRVLITDSASELGSDVGGRVVFARPTRYEGQTGPFFAR